ncbi:Tim17/Tim22/Tim23/Pmp24 family-domain-containing protein [Polychytrium aggregatum]|uniref:Tim17/Tim22/Tim23/Pmp24 family-domain-containing protein n=1 Tax=Polychytrium aggregatum TaxID=110093 RepID=UPI0022FE6B39|nr:Tim17/Tim22/Tim23/Pmp24 family-domain-containing protein [Polychytrium aggregatum]KAI9209124.1 Tim17/Tim22/Tim23/Pmp24 family-domain-containing protein [Polychytrium aggregatum]
MTGRDTTRDPCPYSIVSDFGVGFALGVVLAAPWHAFKGYRNSPRGERFSGALTAIKAQVPVRGGNFAAWSGLFNASDCTLQYIRGKEDPWNAIMAGAATGGMLAIRSGPKAIAISATMGGIILAVMEGVGIMMGKMMGGDDQYKNVAPIVPTDAQAPPPAQSAPQQPQAPQPDAFAPDAPSAAPQPLPKSRFGFA